MPRTIAKRRGRTLSLSAFREINRVRESFWPGCLLLPVRMVVYLIRNIYRSIVYVFTVYDATEKLSYYWHRAFLLDYMIGRGHLDSAHSASVAAEALRRSMVKTEISPVLNIARQVVDRARVQMRALIRATLHYARLSEEKMATTSGDPAEVARARMNIEAQWGALREYLIALAVRYDAAYDEVMHERASAAAVPGRRRAL